MRKRDELILAAMRRTQDESLSVTELAGYQELEAAQARAQHRRRMYELKELVTDFLAFMAAQPGLAPERFLTKLPAAVPGELFGSLRARLRDPATLAKTQTGWRLVQTTTHSRASVRPERGLWYGVTTGGQWIKGVSYPDGWHPDQADPNEEQYHYRDRPWLHYTHGPADVWDGDGASYVSLYGPDGGDALSAACATIGQLCSRLRLDWPVG